MQQGWPRPAQATQLVPEQLKALGHELQVPVQPSEAPPHFPEQLGVQVHVAPLQLVVQFELQVPPQPSETLAVRHAEQLGMQHDPL